MVSGGISHIHFEESSHLLSRILLHLGRDMPVGIQGEACGIMPKETRQGLHIHTILECQRCECMPLRYNYDKPEKPRISRVFGYQARFFILFQPEKSSREVVIS